MSLIPALIVVGVIAAAIVLLILLISKQYKKVGPNEVLIISGGRKRAVIEPDGTRRKVPSPGAGFTQTRLLRGAPRELPTRGFRAKGGNADNDHRRRPTPRHAVGRGQLAPR